MARPQFSLKTLLWLMVVVAALCAAGHYLKPVGKSRRSTGIYIATTYYWANGVKVTVGKDEASDYPTISIDYPSGTQE